ncbi:cupredoxin domain-containing protein, partial [Candidatus Parcubacteria bacterium]|nr:cupredoxin domain-containing protein [Candidatus Parcubacteria bacterium]
GRREIAVLIILGYLLYRNYGPSGTTAVVNVQQNFPTTTAPAGTGASSATSSAPTTGAVVLTRTFTVTGQPFSFTPHQITVNRGEKVKIVFKNISGTHDLRIDAFGVATPVIAGGAEATVEFTPTKAGSYEYYCSVGNHRAMGMKGTLVVQ